jgi:riboflavin biosynthesis pyrimidine reductase
MLRAEYGVRRLLCEGGPELFGSLLDLGLPDEMFHTVSPLLIGADPDIEGRLGLTGGRAWQPDSAPAFDLISARAGRRDRSHLFLRYRRRREQRSSESGPPKSGQTVLRDT